MVTNAAPGREVPVAGTYTPIEAQPQSITAALLAPIDSLYNHQIYTAETIDVVLFILVIGGFLEVVNKAEAMDVGIERVTTHLDDREERMIPILMTFSAAGGTIYGMTKESLPFYTLLMPVMIAARFGPLVAVAIVLLGSGVNTLGSTINLFATVIAANAAGIPFTQGILLRVILLLASYVICVYWVMRYARKVRNSLESSTVADKMAKNQAHFLGDRLETMLEFTPTRKAILIPFATSFTFMTYGVAVLGWWMAGISAVFLATTVIVGVIAHTDEETFTSTSIDGMRDLLDVVLIIGIVRGVVVVMDNGMTTYMILHSVEDLVSELSTTVFINVTCQLEVLLSFLVPSPSGLAVLTMPIMTPLADFARVQRDPMVTAYQSTSGVIDLTTPTSTIVIDGLAIARVPWVRYLRWVAPLLLILTMLNMVVLSIVVMI